MPKVLNDYHIHVPCDRYLEDHIVSLQQGEIYTTYVTVKSTTDELVRSVQQYTTHLIFTNIQIASVAQLVKTDATNRVSRV